MAEQKTLVEVIAEFANRPLSSFLCEDVGKAHLARVRTFLYGKGHGQKPLRDLTVTPEVHALVDTLGLQGKGFEFLGSGVNGTVYGNSEKAFRIETSSRDSRLLKSVATDDSRLHGLAAEVYTTGRCNGIRYALMERLNTQTPATLDEVIPFLFRAREAGLVYTDPQPGNFGHDAQRRLKVLDHEHFQQLGKPPGNFSLALQDTLDYYDTAYPRIIADRENTYVIFNPERMDTPAHGTQQKRLLASLAAVGVRGDEIEAIENTSVLRIGKTRIEYGTPPASEPLPDYLGRMLAAREVAAEAGRGSGFGGKTM